MDYRQPSNPAENSSQHLKLVILASQDYVHKSLDKSSGSVLGVDNHTGQLARPNPERVPQSETFRNPFLCSRQGSKEKSLGKDYPEERKRLFWGSSWNSTKNIINFAILCVFHWAAGRRWKRTAKPCIPPQLQAKRKAVCVLHHQPGAVGYGASRPHSPSRGVHSIQVPLKRMQA